MTLVQMIFGVLGLLMVSAVCLGLALLTAYAMDKTLFDKTGGDK